MAAVEGRALCGRGSSGSEESSAVDGIGIVEDKLLVDLGSCKAGAANVEISGIELISCSAAARIASRFAIWDVDDRLSIRFAPDG